MYFLFESSQTAVLGCFNVKLILILKAYLFMLIIVNSTYVYIDYHFVNVYYLDSINIYSTFIVKLNHTFNSIISQLYIPFMI